MQAHRLVGPIPATVRGSAAFSSSSSSSITTCNSLLGQTWNWPLYHHTFNHKSHHLRGSASAKINGEQEHYAVLGVARDATSAAIKGAYRLLARKYHPDVSKHSQAGELFKSARHAYEILSNEVTRNQYDQTLRFQEDTGRSYCGKWYYDPEFEARVKDL